MSRVENQNHPQEPNASISTAEAFYLIFRSLPKKDRLAVVHYILEDEEIKKNGRLFALPNKKTLKAFAEDKSSMPVFNSIDDLRKDLLLSY